jgi:hypothetical protein
MPWRRIRGVKVQLHSLLSSAIDGGEWSNLNLGLFTFGKESRYPLNRRISGPQGLSDGFCRRENLLSLPRLEPRTVKSLAHRYTGYSFPAQNTKTCWFYCKYIIQVSMRWTNSHFFRPNIYFCWQTKSVVFTHFRFHLLKLLSFLLAAVNRSGIQLWYVCQYKQVFQIKIEEGRS